ncbi:HGGxSTG domain-containing protein [Reyranella sp.]|uniref:HGGxSTG domain-containing protein n=1 Tax=Reyranella sp. TaxID=1929291 RepID=UPI0025E41038|nr:HGGxSTG domain-containing protein [Reyranella sp.]
MADKPRTERFPGRGCLKNGNRPGNPDNAPRCGAKTRNGGRCRSAAMPNGRCRMHGGPSTGPRTEEGKAAIRARHWKHGRYSYEAIARRRAAAQERRQMRITLSLLRELLCE